MVFPQNSIKQVNRIILHKTHQQQNNSEIKHKKLIIFTHHSSLIRKVTICWKTWTHILQSDLLTHWLVKT